MKNHTLTVCLFASVLLNLFFAFRPRNEAPPRAREVVATPPAVPEPVLPEPVDETDRPIRPAAMPGSTPLATAPVVSLIASPGIAPPGTEIQVTCTVHGASPGDWIGLYPIGADITGYKAYQMVVERSATYAFKAPPAAGAYEFRYVLADDRTSVAVSGIVTVSGPPPPPPLVSLQSLATTVRRGEEIPARVAIHSGRAADKDWIGIYAPEARNEDYLTWVYAAPAAGGLATLKAPDQPGVYEIRYLLDNGYEAVAVSARIFVTE